MGEATIIGIDLAKGSFQVHGAKADGSVSVRYSVSGTATVDSISRGDVVDGLDEQ